MTILKNMCKIGAAALLFSLFSEPGAKAGDVAFDSGALPGLPAAELRERTQDETRSPVPSPARPSSELTNFWGNLTDNTFDKICKSAALQLKENARLTDLTGIEGGLKRNFKAYPDKRLTLIDEVNLKINAAIGAQVLAIPNYGSVGVSVNAGFEGRSLVVRPLDDNRYCVNLPMLVKLYDVKTVLPITVRRIDEMKTGEIWKLPLVVRYGISAGMGSSFSEVLNVGIGAGMTRENKPSVSLYKMAEDKLRVRFRVDQVTIKSLGVSAAAMEIPAGDIGAMGGEDLIARTVNRTLARELNKFIALKLGYSYVRVNGQKLLLEFYVDPGNPEQVEKLAGFLKGNLDTIEQFIKLGLRFGQFNEEADSRSGIEEIESIKASASAAGGAGSFAGADHYNTKGHNFSISIPVVTTNQNNRTSGYHRYQSLDNEGAAIHVQQGTRVSNGEYLKIPFLGTLMKHNSTKDLFVVNQEKDGEASKPVLLYQKHEGFIRQNDATARGMVDEANNVLKYAGRKGDGVDLSNTLPSAELFPPLPKPEQNYNYDVQRPEPVKTYRSALMSFRLVFAEQAVQDIIFAPVQMIMKSFMNVMRETEGDIINKVMDLFTVSAKGEVTYDERTAAKRLDANYFNNQFNGSNPLDIVRTLAYAATKFIAKITRVREQPGWKAQSEQLAKAGTTGDMKYEDFLKVVIQLVDTRHIASEIYVHTDKKIEGEPEVSQNYSMFNTRENGFDNTVADVTRMRERFAEPSDLTD